MIAVTFALPAESSFFVSQLKKKRRVSLPAGALIFGEIGSHSIAIVHTGVGRKNCETRMTSFMREQQPDILISSGFAGAVCSGLEVGDLFLAQNFSDTDLSSLVQKILNDQQLRLGNSFTSSSIVDSVSERNEIARAHAAEAVDMETAVIAKICAESGTTMVSLRVITDTPREPLPAPPSVMFDVDRQRTDVIGLAAHLLTRPVKIVRMARFGRQISRARQNLTTALIRLLQSDSLGRIG
jgi:adenosylhomocysteine nucleosidase